MHISESVNTFHTLLPSLDAVMPNYSLSRFFMVDEFCILVDDVIYPLSSSILRYVREEIRKTKLISHC